MRPVSNLCLAIVVLGAFGSGGLSSAAQAQSGAVKDIFEKHNLLGTFAWDCGKLLNRNNLYYVNRLLDADHIQRDQMSDQTTRDWVTIRDKAAQVTPNEIAISGTRDGKPVDGVWRIERAAGGTGDRMLQVESSADGKKLISGGRLLSTGREMPWIYRCGAF